MTDVVHAAGRRLSAVSQAWRRFWFQPQEMYTLGLVRMAYGALALLWGLWLLPVRNGLIDADGVTPVQPPIAYPWGVFALWNSNEAVLAGLIILVLSAIALLVGWHSRIAAVVTFVLIASFQQRFPGSMTGGDLLVRIEGFLIAISPCGAALSLDQKRRAGSFWSAQTMPCWPIRLLQVQFSLIYLSAVRSKLAGETWLNGSAVSYALRIEDMQRVPLPHWFVTNALMMNAMTWGAVTIELAVGVLVWFPRLRPWVLGAGIVLHVMIDVNIQIGIFSYAMFVMYLVWIPPDTIRRRTQGLITRRRRGQYSSAAQGPDSQEGEY